jgi:hypothetical protein
MINISVQITCICHCCLTKYPVQSGVPFDLSADRSDRYNRPTANPIVLQRIQSEFSLDNML